MIVVIMIMKRREREGIGFLLSTHRTTPVPYQAPCIAPELPRPKQFLPVRCGDTIRHDTDRTYDKTRHDTIRYELDPERRTQNAGIPE